MTVQTAKKQFVNKTPNGRQRLGSDGDKGEENYRSDTSDTSGDNMEAGFFKTGIVRKPGIGRRLIEYARRRRTAFADWSSAQPRSVWTGVILAILGAIAILYVFTEYCAFIVVDSQRKSMANVRQCFDRFIDIFQHTSTKTDSSQ